MENTQISSVQSNFPTTPSVSQTPIIPTEPKSSKLLIITLSILLIAALSGMIYFYLQNKLLKESIALVPTVAIQPSATPTSVSSPTLSATSITNWKSYDNELFGFSFKYPVEYSLNDNLQQSADPLAWTTKNSLKLENPSNSCSMWIMINPDGFGPLFPNKTLLVDYSNNEKSFVITEETVGTENLTENIYNLLINGSVKSKNVTGFLASASCPDSPKNRSYLDGIINQMLPTFKFAN